MIRMMATTISSSMSENPFISCAVVLCVVVGIASLGPGARLSGQLPEIPLHFGCRTRVGEKLIYVLGIEGDAETESQGRGLATPTAAKVTFFGISCPGDTTDSRIRGDRGNPQKQKSRGLLLCLFLACTLPQAHGQTYCNGAMLVVQAPEPIAVLLTRITASANEQK